MSFSNITLPNPPDLFGDIDSHRTPGNAAAATDAARCAELIDPGGQLVGHPLPVPGERGRPHNTPVNIRVLGGEARVPAAPALAVIAGQIGNLLDGAAKTGRTYHRAI